MAYNVKYIMCCFYFILTNYCPSVLDTVGWVIWPVKIVPGMTYNVFDGTLNPTLPTYFILWFIVLLLSCILYLWYLRYFWKKTQLSIFEPFELCQMICETPLLAQQPSDNCWKHTFSLPISTFSALLVSHVMRYINLRYLLLLTYLL